MEVDEIDRLTPPVSSRDHRQGPDDAPVTLVEFGDFECPHCGRAYPIIKEVQSLLGDKLLFVFRHFPITTSHPHAQHAAEAAEAAGAQGKFWEMHDILFENQHALDDSDLAEYARMIGLDLRRFVADMRVHKYAQHVREDFRSGILSGVNGTPTFFINGLRYDGPWDAQTLTAELLAAIEAPVR
jgi:protein-disulfide isomerase